MTFCINNSTLQAISLVSYLLLKLSARPTQSFKLLQQSSIKVNPSKPDKSEKVWVSQRGGSTPININCHHVRRVDRLFTRAQKNRQCGSQQQDGNLIRMKKLTIDNRNYSTLSCFLLKQRKYQNFLKLLITPQDGHLFCLHLMHTVLHTVQILHYIFYNLKAF